MKVHVIAWNDIRKPTGELHDKEGLTALDAITYGPDMCVDEITEEIRNEIISEFEAVYPNFAHYDVVVSTE